MIERGETVTPIFDAGQFTPDEAFALLINSLTNNGIPNYNGYMIDELRLVRRIENGEMPDPNDHDIDDLTALYKKSRPIRPTGPRLIFAHEKDRSKHEWRNGKVERNLKAFKSGDKKYIDPVADFILARTRLDRKVKPGVNQSLRFEDLDPKLYREYLIKKIKAGLVDIELHSSYPNYIDKGGFIMGINASKGIYEGTQEKFILLPLLPVTVFEGYETTEIFS